MPCVALPVTGCTASTDGPQSDPPCRPAGSSPFQPPTRTSRPGASPKRCLPPGSLPAHHSYARIPLSHSTLSPSRPPGGTATKGLGGRIVPAPRSLPVRRSGSPELRRAAGSAPSPGSPRPRCSAAGSRPGFRPRFPTTGPGRLPPPRSRIAANPPRLTCRAALALRHGRPPPPRGSPQPSVHRSRRGMGRPRSPTPGEAPLLPPVPTPPRLPAGGAAAARPRRWQGAARPLPAAGPAAAERGALRLGEDERSAIADRFPKTTDCRVTVTAPQCFICLWSGLFLDPCPSQAPIPLVS